jgi:thiol-disulfide isomerase/thioredoxin
MNALSLVALKGSVMGAFRPAGGNYVRSGAALLCVVFSLLIAAEENGENHPILPIGSPAPDFCLPGVDGTTHCLKDYAVSKVLVIAFICNHCPTSQLYETRIKQLAEDYKQKGVALVAIEPNNPDAVELNEMGYTDVGDSLEEMKIRAEYRHFNFPYLYDGETQKVSTAYGPSATPHLFIFDSERKLRYEGRVDNNVREPLITRRDARKAIDALLAGNPVSVPKHLRLVARPSGFTRRQDERRRWRKLKRKRFS